MPNLSVSLSLTVPFLQINSFVTYNGWLCERSAVLQENKLLRVASYHQLQGMSQQLHLLTDGRVANLDYFTVPDGIILDPVGHGMTRLTERDDGTGRVRAAFSKPNGERLMLVPDRRDWWVDVPLLVLQLDQGPTCCGGAA